jgi:hypothetical protein
MNVRELKSALLELEHTMEEQIKLFEDMTGTKVNAFRTPSIPMRVIGATVPVDELDQIQEVQDCIPRGE